MRSCYLKVQAHLAKLSIMGVTDIPKSSTKHINDFSAQQATQIERFQDNFRDFRALIIKLVLDACKTTFTEQGFSYDDYHSELGAILMSTSRGAVAAPGLAQGSTTLSGISQLKNPMMTQPVKKLTFIEQANKRQCCLKARFAHIFG